MSKIVVLTGSPRKKGNSNSLADSFCNEARLAGHKITRFDTTRLKIGGCRACDACFVNDTPCAFEPKYNMISDAIEESDVIVLIFPVYWYAVPPQLKSVIDHWYAFCMAEKTFKGKKAIIISCCGEYDMSVFDSIRSSMNKSFELLECDEVEELYLTGIEDIGDINNTDGITKVKELAHKF